MLPRRIGIIVSHKMLMEDNAPAHVKALYNALLEMLIARAECDAALLNSIDSIDAVISAATYPKNDDYGLALYVFWCFIASH